MRRITAVLVINEPAHDLPPYDGNSLPQLVQIANRPLLDHTLERFSAAGIADVLLAVSNATAEDVRAVVGDGSAWQMRAQYLMLEPPLGASAALLAAHERWPGLPVLLHDGASIANASLAPLMRRFQQGRLDALLVGLDGDAQAPAAAGERDPLDVGRALAFIAAPTLVEQIAKLRPSWRGQVELGEALEQAIANGGRVESTQTRGWKLGWSAEELLQANRLVLDALVRPTRSRRAQADQRVSVHPSARVEDSVIRGPVVIGAGATIVDAYVGPYTSVGNQVRIEGTEVEDSILFAGASIVNLGRRLEASVVGRASNLRRDFSLPSALRMRVSARAEVALA